MGRTAQSDTKYLPPIAAGDGFAWSWDHAPVNVPRGPAGEALSGVSAVIGAQPPSTGRGECSRAGLSRASVHVVALTLFDGAVAIPAAPAPMLFEVWAVGGEAAGPLVTCTWVPTSWAVAPGFLVQVSGLLCEGFELRWGVNPVAAPAGLAMRAHLRWVVDRPSGDFQVLGGRNTTIVSIPIVRAK